MDLSMYRDFAEVHEERHWWFKGRRRIVASLLRSLLGGRNDLKLLEIGCGTGGMLPILAAHGRVTGIDPSEDAIRYSAQRHGRDAELLRVDFPAEMPPGGGYDVVALFDVLEHLDDDVLALRRAASLLADGGLLIATVPAHRFLWSPHDVINHHRRRYARRELRDRIREAGLGVERVSYFNMFLFPAVLLARLLRRDAAASTEGESDFKVVPGPLNAFLAGLFGGERVFLRLIDLPFGVSLLAVARKDGRNSAT
ncbi:MAG TPA: class I SAM-dependent methyltransferase [Candidatus Polarisedimenticolia bacterium]|jgi:SAM-dependent methyltransferase|nr:class I SAM-dependent methyltransferase [Candidatus Polarisedimenticolia bacterium]